MTQNQLLTAKQLGLMLALSTRQIFRLTAAGKLPRPVRIGGAVRWKLSDIQRWQDLNCPDRAEYETRTQPPSRPQSPPVGLNVCFRIIIAAVRVIVRWWLATLTD